MRIRILPVAAVLTATAALAGTFTPNSARSTDTVTAVADQVEPQISTTAIPAGSTPKMEVLLTEDDIEKAKKRVKGELVSPSPETAQSASRARPKAKLKDTKGTEEQFKKVMADARAFATEAKNKPFKLPERKADKSASTLSMSNVNAFTHTYSIGDTPPDALAQLCFFPDKSNTDYTFVFDRYSYCERKKITADYWKVDKTTGAKIEHMGTTYANMELFGQNSTTNRSTRLFARIQKGSVDYDWGIIDDWATAPGVPLSLIGQCQQVLTACSTFQPSATMTWGSWDNSTTWYPWDTSSPEYGMWGRDKLGLHRLTMEYYTDSDEYDTDQPGVVQSLHPRCDSATYFSDTRPQSCVFQEVIPFIAYSTATDSPNRDVAQHIQDAFANPNSTYPTSSTWKRFPGEYDGTWNGEGLHRLTESLHSGIMDANTAEKDAACQKTGNYSTTGLPLALQPTTGQDCDEFPFRSTVEGAASPNWDFSVRAVNRTQNQSAGGSLLGFYGSDRVLAWDLSLPTPEATNDTFYVRIS
ncbi:NucA/NucB deoxyribonuclease domain-containing protein [Streptomyces acidicola]|nr:NucA/NucB deoxyribonuclease domain-containing protein [Streptomyces acidicola]